MFFRLKNVLLEFLNCCLPVGKTCALVAFLPRPPPAHRPEEDAAVLGRDPPEPVGRCVNTVCGQALVHSVPCAGSHGRHPSLSPGGNASGCKFTGTRNTLALRFVENLAE